MTWSADFYPVLTRFKADFGFGHDRLRDHQRAQLRGLVRGRREGRRGPRCGNRLFVDALL